MTDAPQVLVVAQEPVAQELSDRLGAGRSHACADPYDALLEMGRQPWSAVVLAADGRELAGLARAARRLQKRARIVAVCPPADEPDVGPLAGGPLDDYLIYPPSREELAGALEPQAPAEPGARTGAAPAGPPLASPQLAELIDAARNLPSLEAKLAELAGGWLDQPVRWLDAGAASAGGEVLLRADEPPRAMVSAGSPAPVAPRAQAALAYLQHILPALWTTARRTELLRRMSITDELTGVYNRRYFYRLANEILPWSRQRNARVTLLLYDLDDFKKYNDTYGHAAGDEILRETALLMKRITRAQDIVARVGGEEFAVLFWEAEPPRAPDSKPPESAYQLADRFRRAVSTLQFRFLGPRAQGALTISGGLASFPRDGGTIEELLRKADQALAVAKRSGKNAIRLVGSD